MKVLQWNIWYKEDIRNILSTLKEIDADVICLQEITINHPHHNSDIDILAYLEEGLGFNSSFKEAQTKHNFGRKREQYGNVIFSRYPIVRSSFHYIQEPCDPNIESPDYAEEGRVYIEVSIDANDKKYDIGTTHMSYTDEFAPTPAKEIETNKLLEVLKKKKKNFIFTGDLNSLPDSYTITEIQKYLTHAGPTFEKNTWTTKPFSYNGFEANALNWRLDYCFVTSDVDIRFASVVETPFSDHLPILIEI